MSTTTWTQQSGMDSDNDVETINDAPDGSGNSTTWTQGAGMDSATDEVDLADYADQASSSADAASARAAEAATSASTATSQAASAATYATIAQGHSDDASTAKTAAETAKTAAETAETNAETAETNASASATNASTSATNAATSATSASTSASTATTKASEASTSASNAQTSADAALAALDNFDDRYLGAKASDPTVDNDGDALVAGALYFNTTDDVMKVYEGSSWVAAYASLSGALLSANNLSDLGNASTARTNLGLGALATQSTVDNADWSGADLEIAHGGTGASSASAARTNLGLGTAATTASTDYATAAQGTLADSAVQPNDSPTFAGLTTTGNASFGDNDKAIFGAWSDLQIYHDGLNSYIEDVGTGDLVIKAGNLRMQNADGTAQYILADNGGAVQLRYNGGTKLATTSTGVDVTGTVTADGLTVDGTSILNGDITMNTGTPELRMYSPTSVNGYALLANVSDTVDGGLSIKDVSGNVLANFKSNGDISFYEDTGTTPKFFWDASAEALGIGTTSPTEKLDVNGTVKATTFSGDGSALTGIAAGAGGGGSDEIFWENGQNVTTNYTITNGKNAMSAGPITIDSGVTVTVGAGETWTVV